MADRRQHHHKVLEIDIDEIEVGETLIPIDQRRVDALVESIRQIGLLQPIVVTTGRLIAGFHRLEACRKLEWATISATIVDGLDAIDFELASVDENLNRHQLSAVVYAILLGRRKRLYVARHPETAVGEAQRAMLERRRGERDDTRIDCFVDHLARVTGLSACHVRNVVRPSEFFGEQRLRRLVGTGWIRRFNCSAYVACR